MSKRNHVMNLCRVALLVAMYVLLGSYMVIRHPAIEIYF